VANTHSLFSAAKRNEGTLIATDVREDLTANYEKAPRDSSIRPGE
jgi:hypothetical protein